MQNITEPHRLNARASGLKRAGQLMEAQARGLSADGDWDYSIGGPVYKKDTAQAWPSSPAKLPGTLDLPKPAPPQAGPGKPVVPEAYRETIDWLAKQGIVTEVPPSEPPITLMEQARMLTILHKLDVGKGDSLTSDEGHLLAKHVNKILSPAYHGAPHRLKPRSPLRPAPETPWERSARIMHEEAPL